jgi:glutamine amidotransferase
MKKTLIVDYGLCNLDSVQRALEENGAQAKVSTDPKELDWADRIVLPGVGSFADGMRGLHHYGWPEPLRTAVLEQKKPLLGICLGMQLLATRGEEGENSPGLDLISGSVVRLEATHPGERIPHVGWNEIHFQEDCPILKDIQPGCDFYFVHSFHFRTSQEKDAVAKTPYCGHFTSIVRHGDVFGVQFHPEKSQVNGFRLLRNFLEY